ncbi:MAG: NADH-quinone oxidoreductase subunit J [Tannerella sp.]|jgi:NADH-quinone oxidoreductase subunit J|nr:NADH-quinone oxidoreductase subunit J [Tannerella sp.]
MEWTFENIVLILLTVTMVVLSVMAVTTRRILRAATYLLFVLIGTAGIYFQLQYAFLATVQLLVYVGGITVLYVFSILLTSGQDRKVEKLKTSKFLAGFLTTLVGAAICLFIILKNKFLISPFHHGEQDVQVIGHALMGAGKYQYILPFEVVSLLLLACIVGGIVIARKK